MNSIGVSAASDIVIAFAKQQERDVHVTQSTRDPLRVVLGPTAAGKSSLAMAMAASRGSAIISADSRQVYQQFDIGTAKPTSADRARVPHFGLDVVAPTERYSAHAWASSATQWMDDAARAGAPPLIVGGTGFYIRALVRPLDRVPPLEQERRDALASWLERLDTEETERWCRRLDADRAHLGRTQRLRAIETALLAGVRISESLRTAPLSDEASPRAVRYLVVDPGPVLAERIRARVHAMVDAGWFAEVEQLMRSIPPDAPAWNACGYGTIRAALDGATTHEAAIERVVIETRQYAKRQRTWFRHQLQDGPVTLLDPTAPDALVRALAWWDDDSSTTHEY